MAFDIQNLWIFRIIPFENLEDNLLNGIYCKCAIHKSTSYVTMGSAEVIDRRNRAVVKCHPSTVVNDYVPFYFSVRTPMLYNIITGVGVRKRSQESIIYLCCKLTDLATEDYQWCYTDGNAASAITKFYTDLSSIENNIDWRSIQTTDFRDDNADGDEDRKRKKHSEFLFHNYLPAKFISRIVVYNETMKGQVEQILAKHNLTIPVLVNPKNKFYF